MIIRSGELFMLKGEGEEKTMGETEQKERNGKSTEIEERIGGRQEEERKNRKEEDGV